MNKKLMMLAVLALTIGIVSADKIHDAARAGKLSKVKTLLAQGADINAQTKRGWVGRWIGISPFFLGDRYGLTALHCAVEKGHFGMARLLLDNGIKVDATDSNNDTALHYAAQNGNSAMIQLLITKGANVHARGGFNMKFAPHYTPLHYAVMHGHKAAVLMLLAHGADANAMTFSTPSALHIAMERGDTALVELLRAHGAKTEIESQGTVYLMQH